MKRVMYTDKELCKKLRKNLDGEFEVVKFYLDNLADLDYSDNRKAIERLVLESVDHAKWLAGRILDLRKDEGKRLKTSILHTALREEESMREIYGYQLNKCGDMKTRKVFAELIDAEEVHEKLVRKLKKKDL